MLRVPLSEVRSTSVDYELTSTGDALLILLNPCTEIAPDPTIKVDGSDDFTLPPRGEKRRKVNTEDNIKGVLYRVSSHCLAQASSYFRSLFNGTEGDETPSNHHQLGIRLEISQKWDPTSLW